MLKLTLILVIFLMLFSSVNSQVKEIKNFRELELLEASKDTVKKKSKDVKFVMRKSPLKAVLLSAVLPGAGQFYNESYWKLPIVALVGGYFGYEIVNQTNKFVDYKEQYIASQTPENPNGNQQLLTTRNFYRDQRDRFIFYFGIFYVINLVDAYVDAHLYDFDVSDKVRFNVAPGKINLNYNF